MEQLALDLQASPDEPAWAAQWRAIGGSFLPARTPIFEGRFARFNGFYNVTTGKLDSAYLRVCAVHRLYDRGQIGKDQAVAYLKGAVPKGMEIRVVEHWKPRAAIPSTQKIAA